MGRLVSQLVHGDPNREPVLFRDAGVAVLEKTDGGWRLVVCESPETIEAGGR